MSKPLILVTNDDGISSKGIRRLINIAGKFGDIIVVAPDSPQSGKSHSITQERTIIYNKLRESEGYAEYTCSGTPVDAVKIALHEICIDRRPDVILSGINHGSNASVSVLYSGTMAAAIEGTLNGIHSVGFSVDDYDDPPALTHIIPHVAEVTAEVVKNGLPKGISLNVNFPKAGDKPLSGMKVVRGTSGAWAEKFVPANHPYGRKAYWMAGDFLNYEPDAEDTDLYALDKNYGSIVPVQADFNAYDQIHPLKGRFE